METETTPTPTPAVETTLPMDLTKTFVTSIVAAAGMMTVALVAGLVKNKLEARKAKKAAETLTAVPTD